MSFAPYLLSGFYDWANSYGLDQLMPTPISLLSQQRGDNQFPFLWYDGRTEGSGFNVYNDVNDLVAPSPNYGSGGASPGQVFNINLSGSLIWDTRPVNTNGGVVPFNASDMLPKLPISFYNPKVNEDVVENDVTDPLYSVGDYSQDFSSAYYEKYPGYPYVDQGWEIFATIQWRPSFSWIMLIWFVAFLSPYGGWVDFMFFKSETDSPISSDWTKIRRSNMPVWGNSPGMTFVSDSIEVTTSF